MKSTNEVEFRILLYRRGVGRIFGVFYPKNVSQNSNVRTARIIIKTILKTDFINPILNRDKAPSLSFLFYLCLCESERSMN